jgi:hypothetical protein
MQSNRARIGIGVALIAVVVVLFVVLGGGGSENAKNVTTGDPTIVIKNGKPVGGIRQLTYNKGDQIRFHVKSDVADEVHVHGYDLMKDVKAGGEVSFDFPATIEGGFEAELESRKEQIIALTVNP